MFRTLSRLILDILFPCRCASCGRDTTKERAVLCAPCAERIPRFSAFFCPVCGGRVPGEKPSCHPRARFLAGAAVPYDNAAVTELIRLLKYDGVRSAAAPLGNFVAQYLREMLPDPKGIVLVPIPLHASRLRSRGYNQAKEIATVVSAMLGLPVEDGLLARKRHTEPQTERKGRAERLRNVAGCFAASALVRGRVIILIDDVYTSGATMQTAAHALKDAGARRVIGVAAARA